MRGNDSRYILQHLKDVYFSLNFFLGHLLRYVLYHHEWVVLVSGICANCKTAEAAVLLAGGTQGDIASSDPL